MQHEQSGIWRLLWIILDQFDPQYRTLKILLEKLYVLFVLMSTYFHHRAFPVICLVSFQFDDRKQVLVLHNRFDYVKSFFSFLSLDLFLFTPPSSSSSTSSRRGTGEETSFGPDGGSRDLFPRTKRPTVNSLIDGRVVLKPRLRTLNNKRLNARIENKNVEKISLLNAAASICKYETCAVREKKKCSEENFDRIFPTDVRENCNRVAPCKRYCNHFDEINNDNTTGYFDITNSSGNDSDGTSARKIKWKQMTKALAM